MIPPSLDSASLLKSINPYLPEFKSLTEAMEESHSYMPRNKLQYHGVYDVNQDRDCGIG